MRIVEARIGIALVDVDIDAILDCKCWKMNCSFVACSFLVSSSPYRRLKLGTIPMNVHDYCTLCTLELLESIATPN